MKDYSIFRLKCKCSTRMKKQGKFVKMYDADKAVNCPNDNCKKVHIIRKKG